MRLIPRFFFFKTFLHRYIPHFNIENTLTLSSYDYSEGTRTYSIHCEIAADTGCEGHGRLVTTKICKHIGPVLIMFIWDIQVTTEERNTIIAKCSTCIVSCVKIYIRQNESVTLSPHSSHVVIVMTTVLCKCVGSIVRGDKQWFY